MHNEMPRPTCKSLKSGFCGFCAFVRGRGGKTRCYACTGAGQDTPLHNNRNNNNIYINEIAGRSVVLGGDV